MNHKAICPVGVNGSWPFAVCFLLVSGAIARADDLDTIGVTLLRLTQPGLTGAGVKGAQPEAGSPTWEVNPASPNQPLSLFTYWSSSGTDTNFPNALGSESGHADEVGGLFYGLGSGVATNVEHLDNYAAGYFYNTLISSKTVIAAKVVNQSFIFTTVTTLQQQSYDSAYDNYIVQYNTLFASGAGNGGAGETPPPPPQTPCAGAATAD